MKIIQFTTTFIAIWIAGSLIPLWAQSQQLSDEARQTMLEATEYMVEEVSTNGGYVYHYREDFSRRWGELEAYDTMIWIQPSGGTLGMGHLFLDAYEATDNEYYYEAATEVGQALVWGQLPSGGWNYMVDFGGDRSLQRWYDTIGENAWGFEEFYHYYGNATFDDNVTAGAATFLLRLYLEKMDPTFKPALDKAIEFILESQYPLGGWPQRYPLSREFPNGKETDYTPFYTFNDAVTWNNIEFLIHCYQTLGQERLRDPIRRGMNFYLLAQQGNPQGGWGAQYNMKLEPDHARSYEPAALSPSYSYRVARLLMRFYRYTGDRRYLSRIPDAIDWLERAQLPEEQTENGQYTHPTFVELGTGKPLYAHRQGSGVNDGKYWVDYDDEPPLRHYGHKTTIPIDRLRSEFEQMRSLSPEEATEGSPLKPGRYQQIGLPQQNVDLGLSSTGEVPEDSQVRELIQSLGEQGRWLTTGESISRPYSVNEEGEEANTAILSTEEGAAIRDSTDQQYISTREFIKNMSKLIKYINNQ